MTNTNGIEEISKSGKSNRGFASMSPEKQRAIASKGGKAAHQSGNAHEFTSEEARIAGRKGGQASHANRQLAKASAANNVNSIGMSMAPN